MKRQKTMQIMCSVCSAAVIAVVFFLPMKTQAADLGTFLHDMKFDLGSESEIILSETSSMSASVFSSIADFFGNLFAHHDPKPAPVVSIPVVSENPTPAVTVTSTTTTTEITKYINVSAPPQIINRIVNSGISGISRTEFESRLNDIQTNLQNQINTVRSNSSPLTVPPNFTSFITSGSSSSGGGTWGTITGTLSSQTDLQAALDATAKTGTANTFTAANIFSNTVTFSSLLNCTGSEALQTDGAGLLSCGFIAGSGGSSGGGWTSVDANQAVTLATTTYRVGIGATSTPYAKLSVISGSAGTTTLALVPASNQTANILDIYNSSGTLGSVFTSSGKLGIGTTSPGSALSVTGAGYFNGDLTAANITATGTLTVSSTINGATISGGTLSGGSLSGSAVNGVTTANIVLTTGSYADPSWITSLSGGKISGNISGNAANVTGVVAAGNGGTGISSVTAAGVLLGSYAGGSYQQLATSSLGLLTTNVAEGTNLYYLDSRVQSFIHASTTIPKTYTNNTFTGAQTFTGGVTVGTLNGPLDARNGVVGATTTIGIVYGGLGLTTAPTLGQILVGNSSNGYTLSATSTLGTALSDTTGTLAVNRGGTNITNPSAAGILLGSYAGGSWQQLATSSLGLLTTNVAEGSNLYYTDVRVNSYIDASTTIPKTYSTNTFSGANTFSGNFSLSAIANCSGSMALQTDNTGLVTCNTLSSGGSSTGGGWTSTDAGQSITLSTTTYRVAVGASSTPYAKLSILSGSAGTTTVALMPATNQTANILDIYNTAGALSSVFTANGKFGLGSTSPWASFAINPIGGQASNQFVVGSSTATNFLISNSGNVGIGTTSPSAYLAITGKSGATVSSNGTDAADVLNIFGGTGGDGDSVTGHGGNIYLKSGNGGVGDSSNSGFAGGDAGTVTIVGGIGGVSNTGTGGKGGSIILLPGSGGATLTQGASGGVGIGTTSPAQFFSVAGNGYFTGSLGVGIATTSAGVIQSTGTIYSAGAIISTNAATSTFSGGIKTNLLNVTSTTATSTFANGISLTNGCFAIGTTCAGTVTSVNASGGTTGLSMAVQEFLIQPRQAFLLGSYAGGSYQQLATSSLGLLTTNVAEGSNLYYLDSRVQAFVHASTTIPKTYTANTFAGAQTFNGGVTIDSLNGPLDVRNGVVGATTTIGVLYGGTGLTSAPTLGQILVGNSSSGYTLSATSTFNIALSDTTGTLAVNRGGTNITNPSAAGVLLGLCWWFISTTRDFISWTYSQRTLLKVQISTTPTLEFRHLSTLQLQFPKPTHLIHRSK
jgi:fibronectin-binding autotransporter adhesin